VTDENVAKRGGRARVLVVDDSPTALRVLQATLEAEHYEVATASDGGEGLEKVREWSPDLILTDSMMPGVDGFAFLRSLKEEAATGRIPVIMLTSADSRDLDLGKEQLQPDVFVTKSAEMGALLAEIKTLLKRA
jgi:DNA-binding response OmpR family regulator